MADPKADFIRRTRHRHTVKNCIWYDKDGKPRDYRSETIQQFLDADTVFTEIVDIDDDNIDGVWVGTTKLIHGVEMYFSAVLSEDNGYGDINTSRLTICISSRPSVKSPPFSYMLM